MMGAVRVGLPSVEAVSSQFPGAFSSNGAGGQPSRHVLPRRQLPVRREGRVRGHRRLQRDALASCEAALARAIDERGGAMSGASDSSAARASEPTGSVATTRSVEAAAAVTTLEGGKRALNEALAALEETQSQLVVKTEMLKQCQSILDEQQGKLQVYEEELKKFCREHLAGFKMPKTFVFQTLPKTSTGKIQKFELREAVKRL